MDVVQIDQDLIAGKYDHFENTEEIIAIYKAQVQDSITE